MASSLFQYVRSLGEIPSFENALRIVSERGDPITLSQNELMDLIIHHLGLGHQTICSVLSSVLQMRKSENQKRFKREATDRAKLLAQDMSYEEIQTAFDDYIAKFISPGQPFKDGVFVVAQSFKIALVLKEAQMESQRVMQRTYARVIQSDAESSHLEPAEKALVEFFQHYHGLRKWTGTRLLSYVKWDDLTVTCVDADSS